MKLQELSLSDLYRLRKSVKKQFGLSGGFLPGLSERNKIIWNAIVVEIINKENEIINEIALDSFDSRMELSKSYISGNSWEETMINVQAKTAIEVINEIKNEG